MFPLVDATPYTLRQALTAWRRPLRRRLRLVFVRQRR